MITLSLQNGLTLTLEHVHLDGPSTVVLSDDRGSLGGDDATDTRILATALAHNHDAHVHDTEEAPLAEASVRYDANTSTLHCEVDFHTERVLLSHRSGSPSRPPSPEQRHALHAIHEQSATSRLSTPYPHLARDVPPLRRGGERHERPRVRLPGMRQLRPDHLHA